MDIPTHQKFNTLAEAHSSVEKAVSHAVAMSRTASDLFKKPKNRCMLLLGVSPKADAFCQKVAPGGYWTVRADREKPYQFSAWYSNFLPYAYGMMKAEWDFNMMGIDYSSINSYFQTPIGFVDIGQGSLNVFDTKDVNNPVLLTEVTSCEDVELFHKIYAASTEILPPDLPFSEAFQPCFVFVAIKRPDLFCKHVNAVHVDAASSWQVKHVMDVCKEIGIPQPDFKWKVKAFGES